MDPEAEKKIVNFARTASRDELNDMLMTGEIMLEAQKTPQARVRVEQANRLIEAEIERRSFTIFN